ncbi:ABC transporter permease [Dictyobacter aurantiacus]|uniref:ABC transporter permease n=1 Tax=Dictyobacter aurantiacus TaxID=1936993 RepID=A0A401ZP08_9CHLR|nr:ABC transporter permease [Dictyobacter aurantiacus]GCE08605.1 ABC transporter permease [Dictyobacter aurantiacus]
MNLLHNMLTSLTTPQVINGLLQIAAATVLVLVVVVIAQFNKVKLATETITSMVRGLIQILIVGIILVLIINASIIFGYLVLAMMIVFAAVLSQRRAKGLPGAFKISLLSIGIGSGITVVIMALVGVIEPRIATLIPVGSMIISSSMRTNSLALNRFRAEIEAHTGQIEAGLSLGAPPNIVIESYMNNTVYASIIPAVDTMRSLGIVFIPGLASGMLLAGANPIYAAEYQFAAIAMLFAASTLTGLLCGLLLRTTIFSPAEQLTLRPQM